MNEYSGKTIMIIGAGLLQIPAIEIAKEMGLKTVVTDYNPEAPGLKLADVPIIISTKDIEGTVRKAKEYVRKHGRIDGVITVGTDASMTVAAVANALGLPGIKFENAEAATNKIKMRERFKKYNVPCPDFSECWTLEDAYKFASNHEFPLVIKPSDNMGARGVIKINSIDEIPNAFAHAKRNSPSGELIIEEYMEGPELSIDALIFDNKIVITGIADRIIDLEPYFIELGHIMPSNLPKEQQEEAVEVMKKGIKALGITLGAAKGDIKITPEGAKIGELAARLSGGFMSAYTFPYSTGINLIKAAIKIALGYKPSEKELTPKFHKVAVEKALIPQPGLIKDIKGIEEAKKVPGIKEIFIRVKPGDIFKLPTSNVEKAGNVIGVADTREKALEIVDKAISLIKFEIGPIPSLTEEEIRIKAQRLFRGSCFACPVCDGEACAGLIPGMGSVGTGESFKANIKAIRKYKVNIKIIHNIKEVDTSVEIFGYKLKIPVIAAPVTGTDINMNNAIDEYEYDKIVVDGFRDYGTIAMVGDGADENQYKIGLKAIEEAHGWGIPIFKPRKDQREVIKRIKSAQRAGAIAVGMDLDAGAFITMKLKGAEVSPKSEEEIKEILSYVKVPFIVKGVMTKEDAIKCVELGVNAIVVSNHGGRVMDSMPGTLDVLPEIAEAVKGKITVFVDGGIRSGLDVFKAVALGADAVLIGRPVAIYAVGGGIEGIRIYLDKITRELKEVMLLTGTKDLYNIDKKLISKVED